MATPTLAWLRPCSLQQGHFPAGLGSPPEAPRKAGQEGLRRTLRSPRESGSS